MSDDLEFMTLHAKWSFGNLFTSLLQSSVVTICTTCFNTENNPRFAHRVSASLWLLH
jgi:hypothetical protein